MNRLASNINTGRRVNSIAASWHAFWFTPSHYAAVEPTRIAICAVVAVWFISFWTYLPFWFGEQGALRGAVAAQLIDFEGTSAWQHWSPLWWSDALWLYRGWVIGGVLLSLWAASGFGGRLPVIALALFVIAWTHRIVWLQGLVPPAMVALLGYLAIAGGQPPPLRDWWRWNQRSERHVVHWSNTIALKLIRVHWWLLIALGMLSQLGSLSWWGGQAAWWLAAEGNSLILTPQRLRDQPALVNGITHGMICLQAATLWLISMRVTRPLGTLCGFAVCAAFGLLADHVLYGLLLAAGLTAYLPNLEASLQHAPAEVA